jgi:two-component system, NtrC family, response regulator PilR
VTSPTTLSLLVVDDEPDLRTLYELTLLREGYDVEAAGSVEQALEALKGRSYSAVITDMRLPDGTGLDILRWLAQNDRGEKAIVITAYGSAENAVEALRAGAYDYLTKPVDLRQFRAVIGSALGRSTVAIAPTNPSTLPSERGRPAPQGGAGPAVPSGAPKAAPSVALPATSPAARSWLSRMAGRSGAMEQVRSLIGKVARSMAPVMINGESGTGKELVARAIHEVSVRATQPFIAVNCSAIPEQLLEAEFFGYRKGAFTGAAEDREGFFQAANGGTLFLDEIGDLPLSMQSKLLRAIQERQVRPIGAVSEVPVNVRLLSATHKDLGAEVHQGLFRQDLYYRLNVIQIRVPPLRERIADLADIAAHVLERIARDAGAASVSQLTGDALEQLSRYSFPGNVRELENLLHRAVALAASDRIGVEDIGLPAAALASAAPLAAEVPDAPAATAGSRTPTPAAAYSPDANAPLPGNLAEHLDAVERDILERALEQHGFNRTAAGASLGLSLRQMRYRMARLGVTVGADAGGDTASE